MVEILLQAERLYKEGKWVEAIQLVEESLRELEEDEELAEAYRIKGWCWYYIGIKGPEEKKQTSLQKSENAFELAAEWAKEVKDNKKIKLSILNGLPLTLWLLDKGKEAWEVSDSAIESFSDESSVWNTRAILCRWAKAFKESVKVCEKVYETACAKGDYRTAGHGKHNKADALKELGHSKEAREEYNTALQLYKKFEEVTGQSAKFHIEGVEKKLASL